MSASDAEGEGEGAAETIAIDWPFDPKTTVCVPDLRTMCNLPSDVDESGVHVFRALFLPMGKTMHTPDQPGCYIVNGSYRQQLALCTVHFVDSTKRKPELLLGYSTFDVLSPNATGIFAISLGLPLCKSKNIYEDTPRYTKMSDVAGFSNIKENEMPWSAALGPALERQPMYSEIGVKSQAHIIGWVKKPLKERVNVLAKRANTEIVAKVADVSRQCKRDGEALKARLSAGLDKQLEKLAALPPEAYDKQMDKRILRLDQLEGDGPEWLKSPVRKSMQEGAAECISTALVARRTQADAAPAPAPAAAAPAAAGPSSAAATAAATINAAALAADDDDDEEAESAEESADEGSEVEETPPPTKPAAPGQKRARKQPERLSAQQQQQPKKPKVSQPR